MWLFVFSLLNVVMKPMRPSSFCVLYFSQATTTSAPLPNILVRLRYNNIHRHISLTGKTNFWVITGTFITLRLVGFFVFFLLSIGFAKIDRLLSFRQNRIFKWSFKNCRFEPQFFFFFLRNFQSANNTKFKPTWTDRFQYRQFANLFIYNAHLSISCLTLSKTFCYSEFVKGKKSIRDGMGPFDFR